MTRIMMCRKHFNFMPAILQRTRKMHNELLCPDWPMFDESDAEEEEEGLNVLHERQPLHIFAWSDI